MQKVFHNNINQLYFTQRANGVGFTHSRQLQPRITAIFVMYGAAPWGGGGRLPPKGFKKGKKLKYGVFSCIKISFSVIFNKEIHALRGLLSRF